mmetsp:Transcript_26134/g.72059  ORF Transcript_26134/g.72059 Transcript_26134/m.72059 type:complete len:677 (+) Transcript_26134:268-2298(+)|eukprot:CAMPEP_0168735454 /NCGR_PEP_ID=MMETSP0724-20121128/9341_1 /TAXON_ID=265536 /ORGANISM="Amphiprora sp., Strain CCMP467" /LENGTH=676 /DNA_ID=CAMNT_0008782597 /DNA_START=214 /DNA_END=2244 /DNA_ORIENTATION=-
MPTDERCATSALLMFLLLLGAAKGFLRSPFDNSARTRPGADTMALLVAAGAGASSNDKVPKAEIGVGIDLGTTFSAVAYLKQGKTPTIIPISHNDRTMSSCVALSSNDGVLVGKEATSMAHGSTSSRGAEPYYCNVKRVIGTGGKLPSDVTKVVPFLRPSTTGKTFQKESLPNQLTDAQDHPTLLTSSLDPATTIRPEEISSHILQRLVREAESHTGCRVTRAVIGVPAYFHDAQRAATQRAAELAGIDKVKLLREPEAAALAYGIGKQQQQLVGSTTTMENDIDEDDDELVLVFDLGGGTFDCSMLLVGGGLTQIISTAGDSELGGSDFDGRVADHFRSLIQEHSLRGTAKNEKWSEESQAALVRAAELTRIHLSNNKQAFLALPLAAQDWCKLSSPLLSNDDGVVLDGIELDKHNLTEAGLSNSTHILCRLSRRTFESLCRKEFQALLRPVREVAIMSGALLPGDTSPTLVEAALELEELESNSKLLFDDFYGEDGAEKTSSDGSNSIGEEELLLQLQEADMKAVKKAQQRGRKKARNVAKQERKYREQKRKISQTPNSKTGGGGGALDGVKVRGGINGRPISRVVLVGGATRMPAVGRLVAALTGTVPQKTVNPDEAVALGCAVHVGVLDGTEGMGTVLNPMQAAILRAVAMQQQQQAGGNFVDSFDDDEDFY